MVKIMILFSLKYFTHSINFIYIYIYIYIYVPLPFLRGQFKAPCSPKRKPTEKTGKDCCGLERCRTRTRDCYNAVRCY